MARCAALGSAADSTTIIEVRTDREENLALHRRVAEAAALAADGAQRPDSARQHRQHRLELDLGLGQLGGRIGVADDPAARVAATRR